MAIPDQTLFLHICAFVVGDFVLAFSFQHKGMVYAYAILFRDYTMTTIYSRVSGRSFYLTNGRNSVHPKGDSFRQMSNIIKPPHHRPTGMSVAANVSPSATTPLADRTIEDNSP